MNNLVRIIVDKRNWRYWLPLALGIFILVNTLVWIIMSGGRWFEEKDPNVKEYKEYINDLHRVFGPVYMLGYYTVQTNIFCGVTLICLGCFNYSTKAQSWYLGSVNLITITFVVYWTLLAPGYSYHWNFPYFVVATVFLHGVNPIICFVLLIAIRKEMVINKRILGICSMWVMIFYIYSAILYGVAPTIDKTTNQIHGATIYKFLDLRHLFFINLSKLPALALFLNIILLIICPLIPTGISWLWIKALSIRSIDKSYFKWMDWIKKVKENKKMFE